MTTNLPDFSSEKVIHITYHLLVEVMGLTGSSNKRCVERCGARMSVQDEVVFEDTMIEF